MNTNGHGYFCGARLGSQTQPQRVKVSVVLRLVLRTQSRSIDLCSFVSIRG
jgi:hypothetical protein